MKAEMWLARMINDGVLADIVRFNSVINTFAQKDDGESAASWLSGFCQVSMKVCCQTLPTVPPNVLMLNTMSITMTEETRDKF